MAHCRLFILHGLGHVGALVSIAVDWQARGTTTGAWLPARSWLLPSLTPQAAKWIATIFWVVSTLGFVATAGNGDWGHLRRGYIALPGKLADL